MSTGTTNFDIWKVRGTHLSKAHSTHQWDIADWLLEGFTEHGVPATYDLAEKLFQGYTPPTPEERAEVIRKFTITDASVMADAHCTITDASVKETHHHRPICERPSQTDLCKNARQVSINARAGALALSQTRDIDSKAFRKFWADLTNHEELPSGLRRAGRWTKGKTAILEFFLKGVSVKALVEAANEWSGERQQPIDTFDGDRWLQFVTEARQAIEDADFGEQYDKRREAEKQKRQ
jgi:hypothetical protein